MRNIVIVALLGFVFTFPGKVQANQFQPTISVEESQISQSLVEQILRQVEQEYGYDFDCLCNQYKEGKVTIDKSSQGYLVTIEDGGALIDVLISDL